MTALHGIGDVLDKASAIDTKKPSTALPAIGSLAWQIGPSFAGDYIGSMSDAIGFAGLLNRTIGSAATSLFSNSFQARTSAVNTFNSSIGRGSGVSAGGASMPNSSSLWVTPSGAVVNWGGQRVSAP